MKQQIIGLGLSLFVVHVLMYITFMDRSIFWYLYSGTALVMIALSIIQTKLDHELSVGQYLLYGISSGILMYGIFLIGYQLMTFIPGNADNTISDLYQRIEPDHLWKYIVLFLIIIPGEEIFWRGFVQKCLHRHLSTSMAIILTAVLAGSVFIFSGEWVWIMAAMVGGLFWGMLYAWKRSIPLVIVSHLTFDLLFFYVIPFL
ncbi:CPBP family intramembrane glutamic endopeptidase [Jeotgalibacillus soli]|uniref:CAAX amino terminal protease n=1 Tax=Jeotgalibacillus soli TaxID=889306 RepID=A0A0C2RVU3_9BACL|nr:type II CAAX endopeptidase family protein [Jeotgalibacillus soli]KIL45879.1 CAAX amino terminal protease [Jeotgalibacillus soli]